MSATLTVVLPIFAGWLARRLGVLGAQATSEPTASSSESSRPAGYHPSLNGSVAP